MSGDVRYESRSEMDIPLETLNLAEKDRFMKGKRTVQFKIHQFFFINNTKADSGDQWPFTILMQLLLSLVIF